MTPPREPVFYTELQSQARSPFPGDALIGDVLRRKDDSCNLRREASSPAMYFLQSDLDEYQRLQSQARSQFPGDMAAHSAWLALALGCNLRREASSPAMLIDANKPRCWTTLQSQARSQFPGDGLGMWLKNTTDKELQSQARSQFPGDVGIIGRAIE